jgi:hypothetical protein
MGTGYEFGSLLSGSKQIYVGKSEPHYQYQTIDAAIDAANHGDVIFIEPGTYTVSSKLSIAKNLAFRSLDARGGVIITSSATIGTAIVGINVPTQYGSTFVVSFEGITFQGADTDKNVIDVDNNGGAAQNMELYFHRCNVLFANATDTGIGVNIDHTTTSKSIKCWFTGTGKESIQCVDLLAKNAGDALYFNNVILLASSTLKAVATSADNIAAEINFRSCILPLANATSGGHASQLVISLGNYAVTGGTTYTLAVTTEFTGSHTETILPVS